MLKMTKKHPETIVQSYLWKMLSRHLFLLMCDGLQIPKLPPSQVCFLLSRYEIYGELPGPTWRRHWRAVEQPMRRLGIYYVYRRTRYEFKCCRFKRQVYGRRIERSLALACIRHKLRHAVFLVRCVFERCDHTFMSSLRARGSGK